MNISQQQVHRVDKMTHQKIARKFAQEAVKLKGVQDAIRSLNISRTKMEELFHKELDVLSDMLQRGRCKMLDLNHVTSMICLLCNGNEKYVQLIVKRHQQIVSYQLKRWIHDNGLSDAIVSSRISDYFSAILKKARRATEELDRIERRYTNGIKSQKGISVEQYWDAAASINPRLVIEGRSLGESQAFEESGGLHVPGMGIVIVPFQNVIGLPDNLLGNIFVLLY